MVHNGIEYGIMAAYAEGLNILRHANIGKERRTVDAETTPLRHPEHYAYDLNLADIAEVWRRGSVISSWLLDLAALALLQSPDLAKFAGRVSDSVRGVGRSWRPSTSRFRPRFSAPLCSNSARAARRISPTRCCPLCVTNSEVTKKRRPGRETPDEGVSFGRAGALRCGLALQAAIPRVIILVIEPLYANRSGGEFMRKLLISAIVCCGALAFVGQAPVHAQSESSFPSKRNKRKAMPASLPKIGEFGENVYDLAKASDWTKAEDKLAALKDAVRGLVVIRRPRARPKIGLSEHIDALGKAVTAKDRQAAMREANRATLIAANLTEPFDPKVPVDVTRLDYYGRELEIWAAGAGSGQVESDGR